MYIQTAIPIICSAKHNRSYITYIGLSVCLPYCLPACLPTYLPTYLHAYMHACMHTCIHTCMHACMHAHILTHIHTSLAYLSRPSRVLHVETSTVDQTGTDIWFTSWNIHKFFHLVSERDLHSLYFYYVL